MTLEEQTLEEYLTDLPDVDRELLTDLPIGDIQALLKMTNNQFFDLFSKIDDTFTEDHYDRRRQLITDIYTLQRIEKVEDKAKNYHFDSKGNGNGKHRSKSKSEDSQPKPKVKKIPVSEEPYSKQRLLEKYDNLRSVTLANLPKLWNGLEFALSVKSILNIKGNTLPFAGIILGSASSLKTAIIEMFRQCDNTFYTDNFSAKAFVSHNSAVKKEQLKDIDLLPKIKNMFFLTPELAPLFSQREEQLAETLGIVTRILDGQGYSSDTGAQGHRAYDEEIMFTWIGASVEISYKVHKQLALLGPRLYFWRIPRTEEDEEYYLSRMDEDFGEKKRAIQKALIEYLSVFEANPEITIENDLPKIPMSPSKDDEIVKRYIIRLAKLLARLRAVVPVWETKGTQGAGYAYALAIIEDPSRAMTQLRNLARGHALSQGRDYITRDDVPIVIKTVMSTASMERVRIFELLIAYKGVLTTSEIVKSLNTTNPTAKRTMAELKAIGIVDMYPDAEEDEINPNEEKRIILKEDFKWFLSEEFSDLLKEKCTPRPHSISLLTYDYTIIKKLN